MIWPGPERSRGVTETSPKRLGSGGTPSLPAGSAHRLARAGEALASDNDGECLAAARSLANYMKWRGVSWLTLFAVFEERCKSPAGADAVMIRYLVDRSDWLDKRSLDFVRSLSEQVGRRSVLSPSQRATLAAIFARVAEEIAQQGPQRRLRAQERSMN